MEVRDIPAANPWMPLPERREPAEAPPAAPGEQTAENRDVCDISPDWQQAVDWDQMVQDFLSQLGTRYQHVNITIADLEPGGIRDYAAAQGPGAHMVLSTDFLRRMASGAEHFYKGKELLEGLARQLSRQGMDGTGAGVYVDEESASFWSAVPEKQEKPPWLEQADEFKSLIKMMEEFRRKAEENKQKFQIHVGEGLFYSPAEALTRLARANTVGGVRSAMAMAERNICTMKLALALGPDKYKAKLRAAIAALEKVAARGGRKIRDLNEEDDLRRRRRRAEEERQRRRAEQLRYELEQRQTSRRSREHAQITEGQPWFYYQQELMRRKQIQRMPGEGMDPELPLDPGVSAPLPPEGGGAEGFAPCEVTVAPAVEISI